MLGILPLLGSPQVCFATQGSYGDGDGVGRKDDINLVEEEDTQVAGPCEPGTVLSSEDTVTKEAGMGMLWVSGSSRRHGGEFRRNISCLNWNRTVPASTQEA